MKRIIIATGLLAASCLAAQGSYKNSGQRCTAARRLIVKATKVPGDHVLIGANHTHSGGPIAGCGMLFSCRSSAGIGLTWPTRPE